jgi:hypothetical protein
MATAAALPAQRKGRSIWLLAFLLSALVHLILAFGLRYLDLFRAEAPAAPEDDVMEFVFAPPADSSAPPRFTELPEDRAEANPDPADLLSNVDSRARDAEAGGDLLSPPRSTGRAESPEVAMTAAQAGGSPEQHEDVRTEEAPVGTLPRPHPLAAFPGAGPELIEPMPNAVPDGAHDIYQEAGHSPEANAALTGDISLSTSFWGDAHWMQAFRRAVRKNWYPPYAFKIGVIDGWTLVQLEVSPDGELLRLDTMDELGHDSLREASLAALRAAAPFTPLPADFPDETLTITLKMSYLSALAERGRRGRP